MRHLKKIYSGVEEYERTGAKVKGLVAESATREELEKKLQDANIQYFHINWNEPGDDGYDEEVDANNPENHPAFALMPEVFHIAKNGAQVDVEITKDPQF